MVDNQQGIKGNYPYEDLPDKSKVLVDAEDKDAESGNGILDDEKVSHTDMQRIRHQEVELLSSVTEVIKGKSGIKDGEK